MSYRALPHLLGRIDLLSFDTFRPYSLIATIESLMTMNGLKTLDWNENPFPLYLRLQVLHQHHRHPYIATTTTIRTWCSRAFNRFTHFNTHYIVRSTRTTASHSLISYSLFTLNITHFNTHYIVRSTWTTASHSLISYSLFTLNIKWRILNSRFALEHTIVSLTSTRTTLSEVLEQQQVTL